MRQKAARGDAFRAEFAFGKLPAREIARDGRIEIELSIRCELQDTNCRRPFAERGELKKRVAAHRRASGNIMFAEDRALLDQHKGHRALPCRIGLRGQAGEEGRHILSRAGIGTPPALTRACDNQDGPERHGQEGGKYQK